MQDWFLSMYVCKNKNMRAIEFERRYVSRQLLEGFQALFLFPYMYITEWVSQMSGSVFWFRTYANPFVVYVIRLCVECNNQA